MSLDWIDKALEEERKRWSCETDSGADLLKRLSGWAHLDDEQVNKLGDDIFAFIYDEANSLHDRQVIAGMSNGFFEYAIYQGEKYGLIDFGLGIPEKLP